MKTEKKKDSARPRSARPWQTVFAWQHYALTAVAVALIVTGFLLMLPEADVRNRPGARSRSF